MGGKKKGRREGEVVIVTTRQGVRAQGIRPAQTLSITALSLPFPTSVLLPFIDRKLSGHDSSYTRPATRTCLHRSPLPPPRVRLAPSPPLVPSVLYPSIGSGRKPPLSRTSCSRGQSSPGQKRGSPGPNEGPSYRRKGGMKEEKDAKRKGEDLHSSP
jgi:hypothetical protein